MEDLLFNNSPYEGINYSLKSDKHNIGLIETNKKVIDSNELTKQCSTVTAARYSLSGEINLPVAVLFVLGGMIGGLYGTKISSKVPRDTLKQAFAIMLIVIPIYIIIKSMSF